MTKLDAREVQTCARLAGFSDAQAPIVATIAYRESGWDTEAVGDTSLVDAKWGPSIGLMQIRSLKHPEQYSGVDALRVASKLTDRQYNMNTAYAIYKAAGGKFTDWSTWNDRAKDSALWKAANAKAQAGNSVGWAGSWGDDTGEAVSDAAGAVTDKVSSTMQATDSLLKLSETIQNGTFWKRVGIYAAGYVLVLIGILFLLLSSSNVKSAAGVAGNAAVGLVPGGGTVKAVAGGIKKAGTATAKGAKTAKDAAAEGAAT